MESFERLIANRRKALGMTLADLAQQIIKRDGYAISVPYLGTLEQGRCHPSPGFIPQFATVLDVPEDILYFALGLLPPDIRELLSQASTQKAVDASQVMRKLLSSPDAQELRNVYDFLNDSPSS